VVTGAGGFTQLFEVAGAGAGAAGPVGSALNATDAKSTWLNGSTTLAVRMIVFTRSLLGESVVSDKFGIVFALSGVQQGTCRMM